MSQRDWRNHIFFISFIGTVKLAKCNYYSWFQREKDGAHSAEYNRIVRRCIAEIVSKGQRRLTHSELFRFTEWFVWPCTCRLTPISSKMIPYLSFDQSIICGNGPLRESQITNVGHFIQHSWTGPLWLEIVQSRLAIVNRQVSIRLDMKMLLLKWLITDIFAI